MINLGQRADIFQEPFPHATTASLISGDLCDAVLEWMENEAPWKLRIASFYEQWELHIDAETLPLHLRELCNTSTIDKLTEVMLAPLSQNPLTLIDVTAHKLVSGQTIRVHNDYLDGAETHRLLVQLNRGWTDG